MKSLDELESSPDVGPIEKRVPVCLAGKVVDELTRVTQELVEVQQEIELLRPRDDEEPTGPPKRMGAKSRLPELEERAEALTEQADELRQRVLDSSVSLLLRVDDGAWRQWVAAHPARDEEADPSGHAEDAMWAGGLCNVGALTGDLHQWIAAYNDDAPSDRWRALVDKAGAPGDMRRAASTLVGMHTQVVDPGKSRRAWRDSLRSATVSE
ncbi:MAG TPA: hypothetical protein VFH56_10920 [Acidimicrobiales bacterium]|nr:hypothetical protein [Acidimicrobiales bacterium]